MAKRLSVKYRKQVRDMATAYKKGEAPKPHKIALERSKKAKAKKAFRMV